MTFTLESVRAGYGDADVLRDVSLTVPTGRSVALLGANGAGKTTLLKVACGLLPPTSGSVTFEGKDMTGASTDAHAEAGITLIPEGRGVFPNLTVADNLRLFAPPGSGEDAYEVAIQAFPKLGQRLSQLAGTMSGGEQQMLALARAYIRPSSLVLLDEVSMGLAPLLVDEIFVVLRELADQGKSLLIVEQFAAKALSMSDITYVLAGGRIVFAGEPGEVDDDSLHELYMGAH